MLHHLRFRMGSCMDVHLAGLMILRLEETSGTLELTKLVCKQQSKRHPLYGSREIFTQGITR